MRIHNYGNDYVHHFKMELQKKQKHDEHQIKSARDKNAESSELRSSDKEREATGATGEVAEVQALKVDEETKTEEKSAKVGKAKTSKK